MIPQFSNFTGTYLNSLHMPMIRWTDILEILIISFLVYHIMVWIKDTRAWSLLKGLMLIMIFAVIAAALNMTTILWIFENVLGLAVIAFVVVLQPELRRALEQLGRKNIFVSLLPFDNSISKNELFSDKTKKEIVMACYEMGKVKTGALIVIERNQSLVQYESTGIEIDGLVTSQLLINIFEKNTPLHDGAVVIRGNRVTSATCYLPLSDDMGLSKELGTRHRAALGISEVTDSYTIIVSEETGHVSVASEGKIDRNISQETLLEKLSVIQGKKDNDKKKRKLKRKGQDEKKAD